MYRLSLKNVSKCLTQRTQPVVPLPIRLSIQLLVRLYACQSVGPYLNTLNKYQRH